MEPIPNDYITGVTSKFPIYLFRLLQEVCYIRQTCTGIKLLNQLCCFNSTSSELKNCQNTLVPEKKHKYSS